MIKKSFKAINYKLLLAISLTLFIPIIYRTTRIFVIGTLPNTYSFSIAGNLQWINVFFEVLEEAFLLPLFFAMNRIMKLKKINERNKKLSFQVYAITFIYVITIIFFIIFAKQMVDWMGVKNSTPEIIKFVRIEFISRYFVMMGKIALVLLIAKNKWKLLISLLLMTTLSNATLDLFVASDNNSSIHGGIIWVAYDQLIVTSVIFLVYVIVIHLVYEYKAEHYIPIYYFDKKNWSQFMFSGAESFVRNAFFIWFVIKTINKLGAGYNQGDFWVMNTFIWDWLLFPILALSQYLNREQAFQDNTISLKERIAAPFIITTLVITIWLAMIPVYDSFIRRVMNYSNASLVSHLAIISIGFYVPFAFSEIMTKMFYGEGKAHYRLIQSIVVNSIVYIPYYYLSGTMTIEGVALMMATAVLLGSVITISIYSFWAYRNKSVIHNKTL